MPEHVGDIQLVDLKRSVIDKEKSDLKKGKYVFTKKVYFTKADFKDASLGLDEYYQWVLYSPREEYRTVETYRYSWGFEPVRVGDRMWPEGVHLNEAGEYVFKDVILMKCPLLNWLKKLTRDMEKSDRQAAAVLASFNAEANAAGIGIPEKTVRDLLGI